MSPTDVVSEIADLPQSSVGAPLPHVVADEGRVVLAYLLENADPEWDGTSVRVIDSESDEPAIEIEFEAPYAWTFGPPNDEAISGHPLAGKGLRPYAAHRVGGSSWLAELERRNRVHRHHRPERFERLSHFIFVFHDSTFECLAEGFTARRREGPMRSLIRSIVD